MKKEQVFHASTYRDVEQQADAWLSANPDIEIVSTVTEEAGEESDADYSFVMTMRYEEMGESAE